MHIWFVFAGQLVAKQSFSIYFGELWKCSTIGLLLEEVQIRYLRALT